MLGHVGFALAVTRNVKIEQAVRYHRDWQPRLNVLGSLMRTWLTSEQI
jgi:hypothetical protein